MTTNPDERRDVVELLRTSDQPLTAKQVAQKAFGSDSQKTSERTAAVLGELAVQGKVFEFPPERSGYGARFGTVKPSYWVAERILSTVKEAGGRVTLRKVRERSEKVGDS